MSKEGPKLAINLHAPHTRPCVSGPHPCSLQLVHACAEFKILHLQYKQICHTNLSFLEFTETSEPCVTVTSFIPSQNKREIYNIVWILKL